MRRSRPSLRRWMLRVAALAVVLALLGRPEVCWYRGIKGVWLMSHGTDRQSRGVILFAVYWLRPSWSKGHCELIVWHDTTTHNIALGAGWWPGREWSYMTWYNVGDGGGPWR